MNSGAFQQTWSALIPECVLGAVKYQISAATIVAASYKVNSIKYLCDKRYSHWTVSGTWAARLMLHGRISWIDSQIFRNSMSWMIYTEARLSGPEVCDE